MKKHQVLIIESKKVKCLDETDVQKAIEYIVNGMRYGQASHTYGIQSLFCIV